jgi:ATP-binding cassette, subfamily G (WHITE), member 2, SNQ2
VFMILKQTKMFAPKPKDLLVGRSNPQPARDVRRADPRPFADFNGCAKPGEMVLVLGRPGSGCTTFLKTIGLQRGGYLSVEGNVAYGGIDSQRMTKQYLGEVAYNQEDDGKFALPLSLEKRLRLTLLVSRPSSRPG